MLTPFAAGRTNHAMLPRRRGTQQRGAQVRPVLKRAAEAAAEIPALARDACRRVTGAGAGALAAAAAGLSGFKAGLDWSSVDPTKYLYAGTRGESRGMLEAQRVWEAIPEQIRMGGPGRTADYLADKDWSHIVSHSEGGSNAVSNGLWEGAGLNRARGAERMTAAEIEAAQQLAGSEAFQAVLGEMAGAAVNGALVGAVVVAVLAVTEESLRFQRGELDEARMWRAIGLRIAKAAIAGAAVAGLVTAVAMVFPVLLKVLAPLVVGLAVLGFAVYGKRLAKAGAGWYEVWKHQQPLRPLAVQRWLGELGDKLASAYAALPRTLRS